MPPVTTRRAWRIDRAGSLDRLLLREEPLAPLRAGDVRVAVNAVGLNFADIFACLGLYSATPKGPFVPGLEFAGVVEESTVPAWQPGERVVGLTRFGAYATAVDVDARYLRRIRDGWSFADAAAFPAQALTAWYGLVRLGAIERGDVVLVQSAAGGVGLQALALIDALGGRAVAVVGSEAKREWLVSHRRLSVAQVIVRNRRTFASLLDRAIAGLGAPGFDLVLDAVGGPFFLPAYDRLRPGGRLIVYGAADFMSQGARPHYVRMALQYLRRPRVDPLAMISANRSVMGFNLIWLWDRVNDLARGWDAVEALIASPPHIGRRFAFDEAPAAMRYLQSGDSVGKVVLEA